jgi:hypothetical protein
MTPSPAIESQRSLRNTSTATPVFTSKMIVISDVTCGRNDYMIDNTIANTINTIF